MPYRYFFSSQITDPSPPVEELSAIEAESPVAAIKQLADQGLLPDSWEGKWIHFLEWTSKNGTKHGFYSLRLSDVLNNAGPRQ